MSSELSEAYQLYAQGFSHKEITEHLGWISPDSTRWRIKQYALSNGLIYPIKTDHSIIYSLYFNGMSLRDIGRYLGTSENGARKNLLTYCEKLGIPSPTTRPDKAKIAYELRQRGYSYGKIAKMVGYYDRKNCSKAVKTYEERLCKSKETPT